MALKKTTNDIVTAFRLINDAKLTKMEPSERFALISITRQLKKVAVDFDDFFKDVREKMKPEGIDAIAEKIQRRVELTPEEAAIWNKYNNDINNSLKGEFEKEIELDFEPLGKESFERFIESNDFNVSDILVISDVICM